MQAQTAMLPATTPFSSSFCPAIATSSGLAAQGVIAQTLKSGDHIVCMSDVYGGMSPEQQAACIIWAQILILYTIIDESGVVVRISALSLVHFESL